jgi:uncharacterized membrane protein ArfC
MNWWLMALAFVLGLVLTASFTIRRGAREEATVDPAVAEPVVVEPAVVAQAAVEPEAPEPEPDPVVPPHGPGSAGPNADGGGPAGWTVKGNEESKLYHSPESPSFGITRAEVWFRDVETAEAAGFNRWDSGKSQRGMKPRP